MGVNDQRDSSSSDPPWLMILFQESYPDLPNYNGNKYIFYETAKVRDAPEVEDAADEEEETDSSESDSSDDSSDSDVDA